jgi:hypothetical protein
VKALVALLVAGCATIPVESWDRCHTERVIDACNIDDYPPLTAMLPKSPIPPPMAAPPPEPQTADTPASNLLKKLGK